MCLVSVRSLVRGSKGRLIEKIQGRGEILQPFAMNTFHFYNRESQYYVVAFFFSSSLAYIYYFFFFLRKSKNLRTHLCVCLRRCLAEVYGCVVCVGRIALSAAQSGQASSIFLRAEWQIGCHKEGLIAACC